MKHSSELALLDDAENQLDTIMVTIHLDIQDTQVVTITKLNYFMLWLYCLLQSLKNQILADSYGISLNSLESENNGMELIPNVDSINESLIVLQFSLLYRRLWNYTVLALGCDEQPVTEATVLSNRLILIKFFLDFYFLRPGTHDVQDVSITSPFPGVIRVTGHFIKGSTATGVMIAILNISEINFHLLIRDEHQLELNDTISSVESGEHTVSTFVVDENGLSVNSAAAVPQSVMVEKGNYQI